MAASFGKDLSESRDIFPFFDLPRELRDAIYEIAVEDRDYREGSKDRPKVRAVNFPLPHLLQVSRQFGEEYRDRVESSSSLYLSDHVGFELNTPRASACIPISAQKIRTMHIRLASFYGEELPDELELHEKWVTLALDTLSELQVLDLRIDVITTEDAVNATDVLSEPVWINLPHLRSVEIWLREASDAECNNTDGDGHLICNRMLLEDGQKHRLFATRTSAEKAFQVTSAAAAS